MSEVKVFRAYLYRRCAKCGAYEGLNDHPCANPTGHRFTRLELIPGVEPERVTVVEIE